MSTLRWLVAISLVVLSLSAAVQAQSTNRLPYAILTNTGSFSPADLSTIDDYVKGWCKQLQGTVDLDVQTARDRLTDPVGQGGVPNFLDVYSHKIADALVQAEVLKQGRPLVRLNAMVVCASLATTAMEPMIEQGLKDSSQAVRYWAAKAAVQLIGGSTPPDAAGQERLLAILLEATAKETQTPMLAQGLQAISKMTIPAASQKLLDLVNDRFAAHRKDPALELSPELNALKTMLSRIASNNNPGAQKAALPVLTQVVRQMYRYVDQSLLSLARAQQGDLKLSPETLQEHESMIAEGERWMDWAVHAAAPDTAKLPSIIDQVRAIHAAEAMNEWEKKDTWKGTVMKLYNLTAADLDISK